MKSIFPKITLITSLFLLSCANPSASPAPASRLLSKPANLSDAALSVIDEDITYDPTYFVIPYPNGDVPSDKGVCTDVVIRSYRKLGIDLQKDVHEDMAAHFNLYPTKWGLKEPDTNIDHRRVPNLMVFFERKGKTLLNSINAEDYKPGDIVCWNLYGQVTHIGVVVNKKSPDNKRFMIVHNIGTGQILADCLFQYRIIGHYSYVKS
ncbi:MAG TPA: DUF1287 domain-containing protein [Bacteroidia bacterium]|jgi:hypothetical protein|nr:DUF1287 domain-containing protein [Bacteroidia bacterium]